MKYFYTQQGSAIDTTKQIRADDICVSLLLMTRFKSRVLLLSGVNRLNLVSISKHLLGFQAEMQPVSLKIIEHLVFFDLQGSRVLHCQTLDVVSAPCWPLVTKEHLGNSGGHMATVKPSGRSQAPLSNVRGSAGGGINAVQSWNQTS